MIRRPPRSPLFPYTTLSRSPLPLLASSWVDPDDFVPHLGQPKEYDLVMLAHFDPVKRHWLLFEALRKLPRSVRVLLMGLPLDRKSTRLNSSHLVISYAVFCL